MELRADHKGVVADLADLDEPAVRRRPAGDQASLPKLFAELVVELVAMAVALRRFVGAVGLVNDGAGFESAGVASQAHSAALFDDALPTVTALKERGLTLGILTNFRRDIDAVCRRLGMEPYLDFTVTSGEVGSNKPLAPMFEVALERAGVDAGDTIHVGDQYGVDVVGARGVGITPILLDRHDINREVTDCPRIHRLTELTEYLS